MEILYYVKIHEQELGPLTFAQLRSMWNRGEITIKTLFRYDEETNWELLAILKKELEAKVPTANTSARGYGCIVLLLLCIVALVFFNRGSSSEQEAAAAKREVESDLQADKQIKQEKSGMQSISQASKIEEPTQKVSLITFEEIDEYFFESNYTSLQKDERWKAYKGKPIRWTGKVASISEGLFGGLSVQVKMKRSTLISDVHFQIDDSQREKALRFKEGDEITLSGKLSDWGQILGISITEALIE